MGDERAAADWAARLNRMRAVIVPSEFCARAFRDSGVTVPVVVAHEGADPDVYSYEKRPERDTVTTLVVGVLARRKNYRQAVEAWRLAFGDDPAARLILKARFQLERYIPGDVRIRVIDADEPTRGIASYYRDADMLLALGNEGFGLPLIEAMATGLPAVALDSEAQADVCAEARGLLLPVPPARMELVDEAPYGPAGVRAIPDVEAAAGQLRWVREHRLEARAMGRRASAWAHTRRNAWDLGPQTLEAVERHARTTRPLRATYAVWALGGPAGLRYRTSDLCRCIPRARMYDDPPPAWRTRSLHVQHAPGLIDDDALALQVQAAQRAGVSVCVAQQEVGTRATAWEQRADVLIAEDAIGADRLRERWPAKRVEVIPSGCPTWRKRTRDGRERTVAVLGRPRGAELEAIGDIAGEVLLIGGDGTPLPASGDALANTLNARADLALVLGPADPGTAYLERVAAASGVPTAARQTVTAGELAALLGDEEERETLAAVARERCDGAGWPRVAALHEALWRTLWT